MRLLTEETYFRIGAAAWKRQRDRDIRQFERSRARLSGTYYQLRRVASKQHWRYKMSRAFEVFLDMAYAFAYGFMQTLPIVVILFCFLCVIAFITYAVSTIQ